jgi:hypothetical protein
MIYSKNYDKKEIKLNFDASRQENLPIGWDESDNIKVLGTDEYPLDNSYKIIN